MDRVPHHQGIGRILIWDGYISGGANLSIEFQPPYPLVKVFTGEPPFGGMGAPAVIKCIMDGERPKRPNCANITELLWSLIQRCWDKDARNRPDMRKVITELGEMSVLSFVWMIDRTYASSQKQHSRHAPAPPNPTGPTRNSPAISKPQSGYIHISTPGIYLCD